MSQTHLILCDLPLKQLHINIRLHILNVVTKLYFRPCPYLLMAFANTFFTLLSLYSSQLSLMISFPLTNTNIPQLFSQGFQAVNSFPSML